MTKTQIRELIRDVLKEGYLMSLGTVDDGGVWVADVIYVHDDDFNLYWMSHTDVRHSKAIEKNPVACTITANWEKDTERALQIAGTAEKVEESLLDIEKKFCSKCNKPEPKEPGEILKEEHSWYVLRPMKIELIHNELFGFDKQPLELN